MLHQAARRRVPLSLLWRGDGALCRLKARISDGESRLWDAIQTRYYILFLVSVYIRQDNC